MAKPTPAGKRSDSRRYRSLRFPALLTAITAVLAACSLPLDDEVQALPAEEFPGIFAPASTSTSTIVSDDRAIPVRLYFVADKKLALVERDFQKGIKVAATLEALAAGPTEAEIEQYGALQTALLDGLNPRPFEQREFNTSSLLYPLLIDGEEFRELTETQPAEASLIASQIVCTITNLSLEVEGEAESVSPVGIYLYDSDAIDAEPIIVTDANLTRIEGPILPSHFGDCEATPNAQAVDTQGSGG